MLDVTLQERKVVEEVVVKNSKPAYDWRYENSINTGKEQIEFEPDFKYSQWRTNSTLSAHTDCIMYVNDVNMVPHISDKMHYDYLFYSVRKTRRFGKKKTDEDKKQEKLIQQENELVQLIQDFYKYNTTNAKMALRVLSKDQIDYIRKKQEKGGVV